MWEILKSWRNRPPRAAGEATPDGGEQSPLHRHFSTTVNFKDVNIRLDEQDDGEEDDNRSTPPLSECNTTATSPRGAKLRRLERNKLIIIMVGLPGRGKTFLCNKLVCYLNWLGHHTKLFNVGSYRRKQKDDKEVQDASFFDQHNVAGMEARRRALEAALDDLKLWLASDEGQVAIFDATNTTNDRRQYLIQQFHGRYQYLFIESICTDAEVLEQNYRYKMKYSPDYKGMDEEQALRDFKARIKKYEEVYETLDDRTRHYIKLIDMVTGRGHMDINRISGYIPGKIVFFLMQVCKAGMAQERKIWLTRHGESEFNEAGKIGGNASLSEKGQKYAQELPEKLMSRLPTRSDDAPIPVSVWTSTLNRTIETAEYLVFPKLRWKALDEIHAGSCDGLTYEEISQKYPEEYEARSKDKLRYRYPAGESYLDVIQRLEPVIIELERERECVCVVSHQAVLRAVYGYFTAAPLHSIPTLEIPLHSLIELKPRPDGTMQVEIIKVLDDPGTGAHPSLPPPSHPEHKRMMQQHAQRTESAVDLVEAGQPWPPAAHTDTASQSSLSLADVPHGPSWHHSNAHNSSSASSSLTNTSLVFPKLASVRVSSPAHTTAMSGSPASFGGREAGSFMAEGLPHHHLHRHSRSSSQAGSVGRAMSLAECVGSVDSLQAMVHGGGDGAHRHRDSSQAPVGGYGGADGEEALVEDGDDSVCEGSSLQVIAGIDSTHLRTPSNSLASPVRTPAASGGGAGP